MVKTMNGKNFPIKVNFDSTTVNELEEKVAQVSAQEKDSIQLVYTGSVLTEKNKKLSDLGITDNSTLMMILRLRGGNVRQK